MLDNVRDMPAPFSVRWSDSPNTNLPEVATMEFSENFASEAGDLMDSILYDADVNPSVMPFPTVGLSDPGSNMFSEFDRGMPTIAVMKKIGLHHDEAFEL